MWKDELKKKSFGQPEKLWFDEVVPFIESLLKEQAQWISIKDKLPEEKQAIIFYISDTDFAPDERIATGLYLHGQFYDDDFNDWGLVTTHWMPLPPPPTGDKK